MPVSQADFAPRLLREAQPEDIGALLELERACFDDPWTRDAFLQEMALPHAELWMLFDEGEDEPVAYVNFWVSAGEVSLLNVAVRPSVRRQGLARMLLDWMEARGRDRGGESVFLEVRRSNEGAIELYRKAGFSQVGIRKGYYSAGGEDAVVMSKALDEGGP